MREVWAVKHRPNTINEFVGQEHLLAEFKNIIENDAPMQHYIFHSPEAGTGKTSLAYILAKQLGYQIHMYNASSKRQRGIEFVEDELAPMTRLGQYETIFFLDEADQLTPSAQGALKGVIENSQGFFILTCKCEITCQLFLHHTWNDNERALGRLVECIESCMLVALVT